MNKKQFLSGSSFTVVNHNLVKCIGLNDAYWLSAMITQDTYLDDHKRDDPEWFYYKQKYMEGRMGLSCQIQNRISNRLVEKGLIEKEQRGNPSKNWYKICYDKIDIILIDLRPIKNKDLRSIKNKDLSIINSKKRESSNFPLFLSSRKEFLRASPRDKIFYYHNKYSALNLDYLKFAIQFQDTQAKAFPSIFKGKSYDLPGLQNQIINGAKEIDRLVRLDGHNFIARVKPVLEWALNHDFWANKILSLANIRNPNKEGNRKFFNIWTEWMKVEKIDPNKGRYALTKDYRHTDMFGRRLN